MTMTELIEDMLIYVSQTQFVLFYFIALYDTTFPVLFFYYVQGALLSGRIIIRQKENEEDDLSFLPSIYLCPSHSSVFLCVT